MSYLVFARKWRPLTFDDVVGQEHVTRTIKLAIEKNRVAHAYIFSGTRGVGKTTTARILARALNCDNGPTPEPCGTCSSCLSIIHGSSFDVLEIDGASNNGVDDIRELRDNINYTSMGGKYRIYVIDEVHMLTKPAFNALLKTLEEPPKNVIFIFATTEPQKIPETIQSRCQRYDFRRIAPEQIQKQLEKICSSEKIPFESEGLMLIARRAEGSMRDSLSLLDQVFSFGPAAISGKEVRAVLGIVNSEIYLRTMRAVGNHDLAAVLAIVEEVLLAGFDLPEFLAGFIDHLRQLLFMRIAGAGRDTADAELVAQSVRFSEGDILRMNEILHKAEKDLTWSSYPRFVMEVALCKLAFLDSTVTMEALLASLGGSAPVSPPLMSATPGVITAETEKKKDSPVTPAPTAREEPPQPVLPPARIASIIHENAESEAFQPIAPATGPQVDIVGQWRQFIELLAQERPNLGTFLSMATIISSSADTIDLRFGAIYQFQFGEITRKGNREIITQILSRFAGRPIDLHVTLEKKATGAVESPLAQPARSSRITPSLEDDIANEPIIKNILEIFNGDIV
jgi:DNA polymerase-3 subunit gamma/tau